MLSMMPGLAFLYMGDELGLSDGLVEPDRFVDPVVFRTGVHGDNRDGCRTPMPWEPGSPMFGFTELDDGWLPHGGRTDLDTAAVQAQGDDTPLAHMRRLLLTRRAWLADDLADADTVAFGPISDAQPAVVWFDRGPFRCALNTGTTAAELAITDGSTVEYRSLRDLTDDELAGQTAEPGVLSLRPLEAVIVRL